MKPLFLSAMLAAAVAMGQDAASPVPAPVAEPTQAAKTQGQAAALKADLAALIEEMVANVTRLNDVLTGVTDTATADAAAPQVAELLKKADPIQAKLASLMDGNPDGFPMLLELLEENAPRMQTVQDALNANIQRIYGSDEGQSCFASPALKGAMGEMLPHELSLANDVTDDSPAAERDVDGQEPKPMPEELLVEVMQESTAVMEEVVGVLSSIHDKGTADAAAPVLARLSLRIGEILDKARGYYPPETEKPMPFEEKADELVRQIEALQETLYEQDFYGSEALEEAMSEF